MSPSGSANRFQWKHLDKVSFLLWRPTTTNFELHSSQRINSMFRLPQSVSNNNFGQHSVVLEISGIIRSWSRASFWPKPRCHNTNSNSLLLPTIWNSEKYHRIINFHIVNLLQNSTSLARYLKQLLGPLGVSQWLASSCQSLEGAILWSHGLQEGRLVAYHIQAWEIVLSAASSKW